LHDAQQLTAMSSAVTSDEILTTVQHSDDVTQGQGAEKVEVKVKVKEEDEDSEQRETLHRCHWPPWSRDHLFTVRRPAERR